MSEYDVRKMLYKLASAYKAEHEINVSVEVIECGQEMVEYEFLAMYL